MRTNTVLRQAVRGVLLAAMAGLAACGTTGKKQRQGSHDRECLARAMYFESNRSSDEGMLAVGTVVMNRLQSGNYPPTVCGVVGQKKQFAPGVLSKSMGEGASRERAYRIADLVLRGKRHKGVGRDSMFFHTAGYNFPYNNMDYQVIAGGNAFYVKRKAAPGTRNRTQIEVARAMPRSRPSTAVAQARPARRAAQVQVAAIRPIAPARRVLTPAAPQWHAPSVEAATATAFAEPPPAGDLGAASIKDLILAEGG